MHPLFSKNARSLFLNLTLLKVQLMGKAHARQFKILQNAENAYKTNNFINKQVKGISE